MFIQKCLSVCKINTSASRTLFRGIHNTASLQRYRLFDGKLCENLNALRASSATAPDAAKYYPCRTIETGLSTVKDTENEVHVARMTLPDDGNPLNIVHGGVILQIIEEAGFLCATKFCNNVPEREEPDYQPVACTIVRIDQMMFHQPINIGEFVEAEAKVTFTANHSLRVEVKVYAQNLFKGRRRLTNQATLWYVPVTLNNHEVAQKVPPMSYTSPENEAEGLRAYQQQKKERANFKVLQDFSNIDYARQGTGQEEHTAAFSQTNMTQMILQSHCGPLNYCLGGSAMKWADECAAITAGRHCSEPVVTLGIDTINFKKMSKLGDVLALMSRVTFTSAKTLEIECVVDILDPCFGGGNRAPVRSIEAYFTFVRVDKNGRAQPVPPLKITDENEQLRFNRRQQVYQKRQRERKESAK